MMNRIFLIGMSRAGKTELGKRLAEELNYDFYDTDSEIEKKYSMKVSEVYKEFGVKEFRDAEFEVLKAFSDSKNTLVSTGGGIIENILSYEFLRKESQKKDSTGKKAKIIFIDTDPEIIFERIEKARSLGKPYPRFLADFKTTAEAKQEFMKIYDRRVKIYSTVADIHLKNNGSISEACERLKKIILSDTME